MYNPILFVINSNGDVIKKSGIVRAINGYREYAVVITPLSSTAVSMSIMTDNGTFDKKEQYVLPTNFKVSDFVSSDDPLYQSIYDWNVYAVEIKEVALESIALFRTGSTTVTFQFQRIKESDKCVAYKGYFGIDLPLPQTAEIGDYYECEDYNYTIVSGTHNYTFTKGMYVYFNGVRWVKDRLLVELNTPTVEVAVEPSHATGYQLDDDDVNYLLPLGDNIVEALQKAELALQKIEDIKSGLEPLDELTLKDGQGNEMKVTFDGQDPIIAYRGVSAEVFKNLFLEVEPASGVTFTNGMQVMYAGSIGGSGKRLAKPTNLVELKANPSLYLGTITQITEDNHGIVNWYGVVNHLNTSGKTLGAPVYVGDNGSWTTVKPISPLPIIIVGLIERVNNAQGQISVRPNVGNYLNQLHDVYTNGHTFVGGETIMFNLANGRYEVYDLAGKLQQVDDDINLLNSNKANKTYVDSQDAVLQSQINGNVSDIELLEIGKEDKSMKGQPNGYAPLDVSGYIPSAFVPNSFDDVIEFNTYADLLSYSMPQSNKLFVVKQDETSGGNHSTYRWTGTIYIRVTDEMSAAGIKVLYESNADTNSLTDVLKNNYNEAYAHSQIVNSNPHQTTYAQLLDKPTTIEEIGVTNVYNKEYIDALKDKNGWESELLGILANNGTIALSVINQFDEIQMYAKDTLGVIDNENIRPSLIQSGDSVYFFDDTQAFIMVDTVFGFYAPVGYTLQVVGIKYTELKAVDVATSEVGVTVQDKLDEIDNEIKEYLVDVAYSDNRVDRTLLTRETLNSQGIVFPSEVSWLTDFCYVGDLEKVRFGYTQGVVSTDQTCNYALYNASKALISLRLTGKLDVDVSQATYIRVVFGYTTAISEGCYVIDGNLGLPTSVLPNVYTSLQYTSAFNDKISSVIMNTDTEATTEIVVDINGTGDFTTLRSAVESIVDSSKVKPYTIKMLPGIHDIFASFTEAELQTVGNKGFYLPNYVNLKGVGNVDDIVILGQLASGMGYAYDTLSPLNLNQVHKLENITVKSVNCRYAVHDDPSTSPILIDREIVNCKFIKLVGDGLGFTSAYGSGMRSGANIKFSNCDFYSERGFAYGVHNNIGYTEACELLFESCKFRTTVAASHDLSFASMGNGLLSNVKLIGCDATKLLLKNDSGYEANGCEYILRGYGNKEMVITNTTISTRAYTCDSNGFITTE